MTAKSAPRMPYRATHPLESRAQHGLKSREPRSDRDRLDLKLGLGRPPARDHARDRVFDPSISVVRIRVLERSCRGVMSGE